MENVPDQFELNIVWKISFIIFQFLELLYNLLTAKKKKKKKKKKKENKKKKRKKKKKERKKRKTKEEIITNNDTDNVLLFQLFRICDRVYHKWFHNNLIMD